jgi:hypothetical protein
MISENDLSNGEYFLPDNRYMEFWNQYQNGRIPQKK